MNGSEQFGTMSKSHSQ